MDKSTKVYIVRHGESEANIQENKDVIDRSKWDETGAPLTELGRQQIVQLSEKLSSIHFDAVFSSDLKRARETAQILASNRNIPIKTSTTIYERKLGKEFWELPKLERKKLEEGVLALQEEEKFIHKMTPNSESAQEALDRFKTFLEEIIPLYLGKTILVVNHGGLMRFFLIFIKWAKYNELPIGSIKNAGYYVVESNGKDFEVKETYGVDKMSEP